MSITTSTVWDYNTIPLEQLEEQRKKFCEIFKFEPRLRQLQSIKSIIDDNSLLASLTTSYGKTPIAVYAALLAKAMKKMLFLTVPIKALGSEHVTTFEKYGLTVARFDSDNDFDLEKIPLQDVNIFTYEKFDSVMRKPKFHYILDNCKFVIIDEIHNIVSNRGYAIESTIMKIKILKPEIKVIGLSATIRNEELLAKFFKAKIVKTRPDERPVPIKIDIKEVEKQDAPNVLMEQLKDGMNTLTFTSSRKRASDLACMQYGESAPLEVLVEHGIGYHHAGINEENEETKEIINNKKIVEDAYRSGKITNLYATSTLAAGVNLPAKRVIIFDTVRYSTLHGEIPIDHAEILQMAGRSGRNPLIDKIAYCTLYVPSKYMSYFDKELMPPEICSNLEEDKHLQMFVLELVAEKICNTVSQIVLKIMANSMTKIDTKRVGDAVKFLVENRLCFIKDGIIDATFVGKMCVALYIDIITGIHLRDCYIPTDNLAQKFFAVLNTPQFTECVTVREEDTQNITLVYRYLQSLNVDIEMYKYKKELCKAFCLLFRRELLHWDLETAIIGHLNENYPKIINEIGKTEIVEKFLNDNKYVAERRSFVYTEPKIYYSAPDNAVLKRAATRIFMAGTVIGNSTVKNECKFLGKTMIAQKFDYDLALLMQVPQIGDTRLAHLMKAKILKIQTFLATPTETLVEIIGRITTEGVEKMKTAAIQLMSEVKTNAKNN